MEEKKALEPFGYNHDQKAASSVFSSEPQVIKKVFFKGEELDMGDVEQVVEALKRAYSRGYQRGFVDAQRKESPNAEA